MTTSKKLKDKLLFFLKNRSLKWKISIFIAGMLIILFLIISLLVYNYSAGIIRNQVNDNIDMVVDMQGDRINNLMGELERQMNIIT